MTTSDVPFIDLRPYVERVLTDPGQDATPFERSITGGFERAFNKLLGSLDFIGGGATTKAFEEKLAKHVGAQHVISCANGTDALQLALRACGIERGSRVAMPNLTFWATYEAIANVGATPVLLDIDHDDLQLSYDEFVRAHNKRQFDAAVLVHLYGWCSQRLIDFRNFCRDRRITLIEDGAQAFGVKRSKTSIFADADVATLSFHPAKVLGGIGDGGAVLTKNARIAARVRLLAAHGRLGHYRHVTVGWNSRMDAIQAAWLTRALDVIDEIIEARRRVVHDGYGAYPKGCPKGSMRWSLDGNGYLDVRTYHEGGDAAAARFKEYGIEVGRVYPCTIADQEGARGAIVLGDMPISRDVAEHVVNLPLFYGITDEQVARVLEALG